MTKKNGTHEKIWTKILTHINKKIISIHTHTHTHTHIYFIYLVLREREVGREGGTEREGNRRSEAGSTLTAVSQMRGSNSLTMRS